MAGDMIVTIWDVEHGACAMIEHTESGRIAMIDSGHNTTEKWYPSQYIKNVLKRDALDYLFITNADLDHLDDLNGLWKAGIEVKTLIRSKGISPADLRKIKMESARDTGLGEDIERYLSIHQSYNTTASEPFNAHMGGISYKSFWNSYPEFNKTNDLSMAVFFQYGSFKILFPGDLEVAGWRKLLENKSFREELDSTTVLVAAHHGRDNGFCEDVFEQRLLGRKWEPRCVVMSDKNIEHKTQEGMAQRYAAKTGDEGVITHGKNKRRVLTTRSDGRIQFIVKPGGIFDVKLECD